jgi:hypothetical protein
MCKIHLPKHTLAYAAQYGRLLEKLAIISWALNTSALVQLLMRPDIIYAQGIEFLTSKVYEFNFESLKCRVGLIGYCVFSLKKNMKFRGSLFFYKFF